MPERRSVGGVLLSWSPSRPEGPMPDDTVLVYGATGTQGGPVAQQLLDAGRRVRVVSRFEDKAAVWRSKGAQVAIADLGDPTSLATANEGVDRVVLQLPLQYDFALHEAYGRNAIDAACAAGVHHLVFNTSAHVFSGTDIRAYTAREEVIEYLGASGISNVILRPTFYMEILLGPWIKPGIVDNGVIAFPLPAEFPMSWVSASEMASYAIAALNRDDLSGQSYQVGGPEACTGHEIAALFSDALGRRITYASISPDDYEKSLSPLFGPTVAYEVASQVRFIIAQGSGAVHMTATAEQFSVPSTPWQRWISEHSWES